MSFIFNQHCFSTLMKYVILTEGLHAYDSSEGMSSTSELWLNHDFEQQIGLSKGF